MAFKLPPLGYQALREIRAQKAGFANRFAEYSIGGVPKPNPKPRPKITLRRADYERAKAGG